MSPFGQPSSALDIGTVSSREIAAMLYKLVFPTRDFAHLDEPVQRAYISDADRLVAMLRETVT